MTVSPTATKEVTCSAEPVATSFWIAGATCGHHTRSELGAKQEANGAATEELGRACRPGKAHPILEEDAGGVDVACRGHHVLVLVPLRVVAALRDPAVHLALAVHGRGRCKVNWLERRVVDDLLPGLGAAPRHG